LIAELVGLALIFLGVFCSIVGSVGLVRFPDAYIRSHAATVSSMGGAVVASFGASIFALTVNPAFSIKAFIVALIIIFTSPTGTHAILKAAHKSRIPMWPQTFCDKLKEDKKIG